jgi:hypothetical protein
MPGFFIVRAGAFVLSRESPAPLGFRGNSRQQATSRLCRKGGITKENHIFFEFMIMGARQGNFVNCNNRYLTKQQRGKV